MGLSLPHLLILAVVVLVLFGRGRISEMMGDFGKGIKSFKEGMNDEANAQSPMPPAQQIPPPPPANQATLNGDTVIDSSSIPPKP
ncbi:twin-arginine translocase TatA/TatE family subunit [Novosphingobium sp.]|uniref:twin-arginine translocase TatA/TatE family subunit n=1 Tax=Novosphingobium sp. TaxID=1874826 RepID=UPI0025F50A80|nr:twin-arginine translocase TatA/TatE family subunit [Novosphingobium sp.]